MAKDSLLAEWIRFTAAFKYFFREVPTYFCRAGTSLSSVRDRKVAGSMGWQKQKHNVHLCWLMQHHQPQFLKQGRYGSNCQRSLGSLPSITLYTPPLPRAIQTTKAGCDYTTPLCSRDAHPPLSHVLNLQMSLLFSLLHLVHASFSTCSALVVLWFCVTCCRSVATLPLQ